MEILLNEFSIDPLLDFPELCFNTDDSLLYESIMEDAQGTTKKNIGEKIFGILKKIWGWITRVFGIVVKFVKSLFSKNKQSPSRIAEELNIKSDKPKKNPKKIKRIKIKETHGSNEKEKPISEKEVEIKEISLSINIDKEKEIVNISLNNPKLLFKGRIQLMFDTEYLEHFKNYFKAVYNSSKEDAAKYSDLISNLVEDKNRNLDKTFQVSLKRFEEINQTIKEISEILFNQTIDLDTNDEKYNNQITELNYIQQDCIFLQKAINEIQSAFLNYYILPDKYVNTINNLEDLSEFVEKMIKYNYSYDSMAINVMKIYSGDLGDNISIARGMGRMVFFPKNGKSIYKIPFNGFGISGNKIESLMWKKMNEAGDTIYNATGKYNFRIVFAPILSITQNELIIEMERVTKTSDKSFQDDFVNQLKEHLKDIGHIVGLNRLYTGDIHDDNIFKTNEDEITLIDYGYFYIK